MWSTYDICIILKVFLYCPFKVSTISARFIEKYILQLTS